jgi:hypothetical protein
MAHPRPRRSSGRPSTTLRSVFRNPPNRQLNSGGGTKNEATLDPLELGQGEFSVVPTTVLDSHERSQHSITHPSLKALPGDPLAIGGSAEAVARAEGEEAGG